MIDPKISCYLGTFDINFYIYPDFSEIGREIEKKNRRSTAFILMGSLEKYCYKIGKKCPI